MIQAGTQTESRLRKKMKRASGTRGNKRSNISITAALAGEDKKGHSE